MRSPEARQYYASPGPLTGLAKHAARLDELPIDLPGLVRVVQGLVVHPFHHTLYGLTPEQLRSEQLQQRTAEEMLATVLALDDRPLVEARPPDRRFCGNCRHFTVLLVALLRHQGVPARARCGFGAYFERERFVDHWVAEVWDASRGDWQLVDAQLDPIQREALALELDPLDVSREEFWVAGQGWQRCRAGDVAGERFGILDMWGLWFVRANVLRDLAALRKVELLPWDDWGVMQPPFEGAEFEATFAQVDRAAAATLAASFATSRDVYERPELRVPRKILSAWPEPHAVELPFLAP